MPWTGSPASPRITGKSGARSSLSDYYTAAYDRAVFDKSLKENIVFSDHSLATDSVFAEVQLVSCRNVLIYFNRDLQDRAFGLFRDALVPEGLSRHRREGIAAVFPRTPRRSTTSCVSIASSGRRTWRDGDRVLRRATSTAS